MLPTSVLIINGVLLIITIMVGTRTARFAQLYTYAFGDDKAQRAYRSKILKGLVLIVFIGLSAAVLNIFFV